MFDLPERIKDNIQGESYATDSIGMSGDRVLLFADKVLKIREDSGEAENEVHAMRWLEGRLPVPRVLAHTRREGMSYLLMTRVPGQMACAETLMADPEKLTELLARALRELWQVDVSTCPMDWSLERKLAAAEHNVQNGLVDMDNVEPDTFGEGGFRDPEELLRWLKAHKPAEEPVLSHGDFCLPNLCIDGDGSIWYIDLGRTGIADRWQDIAIGYRSLKSNYEGRYGGRTYPEFNPNLLFDKLQLAPDWEKIRYYMLLDELF